MLEGVKPDVQMKQHRHPGCAQPSVSPSGELFSRQARCPRTHRQDAFAPISQRDCGLARVAAMAARSVLS